MIEFDEKQWKLVLDNIKTRFDKKANLQSILFLIGHRELGKIQHKFSKEEKQDLIHVGVCTLLTNAGYYKYIGEDKEGWPHFVLNSGNEKLSQKDQERLLKIEVINYFKKHNI